MHTFLILWAVFLVMAYALMGVEATLYNRHFIVTCKRFYRVLTEEDEA